MTWHGVEVTADGRYQVYATEDSIRRRPVGRPFDRPRLAVDFANALDAGAVYVSPLRAPAGASGGYPPSHPRSQQAFREGV